MVSVATADTALDETMTEFAAAITAGEPPPSDANKLVDGNSLTVFDPELATNRSPLESNARASGVFKPVSTALGVGLRGELTSRVCY